VQVRLSPPEAEALDVLARRKFATRSGIVRTALAEYLERNQNRPAPAIVSAKELRK
jgi:predicted transcriptional regulator